MIISEVIKSYEKDGYEVRVFLGDYPERIFWCKTKTDIVARRKRLQNLHYRLRCLIKDFMNIRKWFPEQEAPSAEKMVRFLFQYNKVDIEKTVRDFLSAAESDNWDGFYSWYFTQLEWIGSASREEIENQLETMYYTKYYKKAIHELTKKRNLEVVLFLRLLMDTGIRSRDVYLMDHSCIEGNRVKVRSSKFANPTYYQCPDGSFPRISKRTLFIAEKLDKIQGKWFTKPYDYYVYRIYNAWYQVNFSIPSLRKYRVEFIRKEYWARQRQSAKIEGK